MQRWQEDPHTVGARIRKYFEKAVAYDPERPRLPDLDPGTIEAVITPYTAAIIAGSLTRSLRLIYA